MNFMWRLVVKVLVRSTKIVDVEVVRKPGSSIVAVHVPFQIDILVLDAAPKPLNENVVEGTAPAIHADLHASSEEDRH